MNDDEHSIYVYIDEKWSKEINKDSIGIYLRLKVKSKVVLMTFNANNDGYYVKRFTGSLEEIEEVFIDWKVNILDAIWNKSRDTKISKEYILNFGFKQL